MQLLNRHEFTKSRGLIPDPPPESLKTGDFTGGQNFQVGPRGVEKTLGFGDGNITPLTEAHAMESFVIAEDDTRFFIAGDSEIYYHKLIAGSSTFKLLNPTGVTFNGELDAAPWSILNFNGLILFNNKNDPVQMFNLSTDEVEDLPNLPAGTRFRYLVAFKNFLFGLGVSEDSGVTFNDHRVMWSEAADPGDAPPDWNIGSSTSLAGDNILPSQLEIRDAKVLGETLYIYKGDAVYAVDFTGGSFVFSFKPRFTSFGILSDRCVVQFGSKHFLITEEDFRIHDGYKEEAIGIDIIKDYFFNSLNPDRFHRTFTIVDPQNSEIWICYPEGTSTVPNRALIWQYKRDTWGIKVLPDVYCSTYSEKPEVVEIGWDIYEGSWDRSGTWSTSQYRPAVPQLFFSKGFGQRMVAPSDDGLENGEPMETIIIREAFPIGQLDRDARIVPDFVNAKVVGELWFYVETSGPFEVYLGGQESLNREIIWEGPYTFDPDTQRKIDVIFASVYFSIKIVTTASSFALRRMDVRFDIEGESYGSF